MNENELGKYLTAISSINRKILRLVFNLELKQNKKMEKEVEEIKKNPKPENNLFFFEGILDFRSLTKILERYNSNEDLLLLINYDNDVNGKSIINSYLKKTVELRNDIWHNNIKYNNIKRYFNIVSAIKNAYEILKKNKSLNKSELFENSIKYLNICLEFLDKK